MHVCLYVCKYMYCTYALFSPYNSPDASADPYILRWPGIERESWVMLWNRAKEKDLRGVMNQQGVGKAAAKM